MSNRNYTFNKFVNENYVNGINLVSGGKIFGEDIDTTNLEEVIAALYIMYQYKDYMVQAENLALVDCPKCHKKGLMSAYLPMCTECANKERNV